MHYRAFVQRARDAREVMSVDDRTDHHWRLVRQWKILPRGPSGSLIARNSSNAGFAARKAAVTLRHASRAGSDMANCLDRKPPVTCLLPWIF